MHLEKGRVGKSYWLEAQPREHITSQFQDAHGP